MNKPKEEVEKNFPSPLPAAPAPEARTSAPSAPVGGLGRQRRGPIHHLAERGSAVDESRRRRRGFLRGAVKIPPAAIR